MRNLRSVTPVPRPSQFDHICPDVPSARRLSSVSQHLPTLPEGSLDCNELAKIISPVFSPSQLGKTEIVELVGSPSNLRREQLLKSNLDRRRKSKESPRLPNLNKGELVKENVQPGSPNSSRLRKHNDLTRMFSHPVISKSKSLPRLYCWELHPRSNIEDEHSAELRRYIHQEDLDYDLFSTKAVILERYLNSQKAG